MATQSLPVRWEQRLAWVALHFREPAHRVCGDLRTAVANAAAAVGCYCLIVGCVYLTQTSSWERDPFDYIVETYWGIACIIAAMDASLFYACKKQKNDKILKYILCATMTFYLLDWPLSLFTYIGSIVSTPQDILPLWLTLRIALCTPHLCLMYCLLVELRGNEQPSSDSTLLSTAIHHDAISSDALLKKELGDSAVPAVP